MPGKHKSLSIYRLGNGYSEVYGNRPEKRYPLIPVKCFPSWRIAVSLIGCCPSTSAEIWLEFRKVQGDVTIVLDIIPPTQPVSGVCHTSKDLIKA